MAIVTYTTQSILSLGVANNPVVESLDNTLRCIAKTDVVATQFTIAINIDFNNKKVW